MWHEFKTVGEIEEIKEVTTEDRARQTTADFLIK
jgi:hypothetical protein